MNEIGNSPQIPLSARDQKLIDFWRWAFSDLRMNDVRGVYAEWMVAKLLGIDPPPRDSWDSCDLRFDDKRIEIKTSAYIHAWERKGPPNIKFTGLRSRLWDPVSGYTPDETYHADIYVFCLQIERNAEEWEALDLNQWRFYVLPRSIIQERNCNQISLVPLKQLAREIHASELKAEVLNIGCIEERT